MEGETDAEVQNLVAWAGEERDYLNLESTEFAAMLTAIAGHDSGWEIHASQTWAGELQNLAAANGDPWAWLARDEAVAEANLIQAVASERLILITARANADRDYEITEATAAFTLRQEQAQALGRRQEAVANALVAWAGSVDQAKGDLAASGQHKLSPPDLLLRPPEDAIPIHQPSDSRRAMWNDPAFPGVLIDDMFDTGVTDEYGGLVAWEHGDQLQANRQQPTDPTQRSHVWYEDHPYWWDDYAGDFYMGEFEDWDMAHWWDWYWDYYGGDAYTGDYAAWTDAEWWDWYWDYYGGELPIGDYEGWDIAHWWGWYSDYYGGNCDVCGYFAIAPEEIPEVLQTDSLDEAGGHFPSWPTISPRGTPSQPAAPRPVRRPAEVVRNQSPATPVPAPLLALFDELREYLKELAEQRNRLAGRIHAAREELAKAQLALSTSSH